jgi:hypothetical protein
MAVVSLALGVLSFVAVFAITLSIIPLAAVLTGMYAWRQIALRQGEMSGQRLANIGIGLGLMFWLSGWALLAYQRAVEVPEGYRRLTFDELQPDENVPNELIPASAQAVDGQRVFMKGYMLPGRQTHDIHEFLLVWSSGDCCFGGNPPLTHVVEVKFAPELSIDYSTQVQRVAGTFHVDRNVGGSLGQNVIYRLDADWVP